MALPPCHSPHEYAIRVKACCLKSHNCRLCHAATVPPKTSKTYPLERYILFSAGSLIQTRPVRCPCGLAAVLAPAHTHGFSFGS